MPTGLGGKLLSKSFNSLIFNGNVDKTPDILGLVIPNVLITKF